MNLDQLRGCTRATLTLQEVAETFGVDYRTVGRACDDGSIPSISLGKRRLIPTQRLQMLLLGDPIEEATNIPLYAEGLEPHAERPPLKPEPASPSRILRPSR